MQQLLTIAGAVATHARLQPQKIGARDSQRTLSYALWHERASRLAAGLVGSELGKGQRVAVLAYNCIEWLEIYVALARAGLVAVPINFRLAAPEIAFILGHSQASALIVGPEFTQIIDSIKDQLPITIGRHMVLGAAPHAGWTAYEDLISSAPAEHQFEPVNGTDVCALMYTSGTTGRPKGVVRKHAGSTLIAMATALEMGFSRADTALLVMPLCHANSLYFATTFVHLGATCIVDDRRSFDAEATVAALARDKVTFTSLVPTHYIMMLALPNEVKRRYELGSVGKLMISSAPARKELKQAIVEFFPSAQLYELYGSTEAGWVTLLRPDEQLTKLGSVGREWAGSGPIRILDEHGNEVRDGEVGELYSHTPYAFDSYWQDPDKTRAAFNGNGCSVGDMARRDADGYLWLVDRKSNMIISGGENIYPSEVEAVLAAHAKVRDVAVIGVPHEKWGESVHAVIVLHDGEQADATDMRDWCKTRLAGFKCPTSVVFIAESQMPRTATGKILHRALRERV